MFVKAIIDFLFPRYCEMCNERLEVDDDVICQNCYKALPRTKWWLNIDYTKEKYKDDDNIFHEIEDRETLFANEPKKKENLFTDNVLAKKFYGRITIEKAMSFMKFLPKSDSAKLVYEFKYHDKPHIAYYLGLTMGKELVESGFFKDIDYIIPVPITKHREHKRGYNQSMELSKGISHVTKIPVLNKVIKRTSFQSSQTTLNQIQRQENINGAFKLDSKYMSANNKHVLLVDDVITTGATTIECCRVLQKIQGIKTSVLSLGIVTL